MKRLHLIMTGRVQGMGFRFSIERLCTKLGVNGWAKNNSDGTLEAMFEADEDKLNEVLEFCKKGPTFAIVENTEINWDECLDEFKEFRIKY
jgi:acylphosphatase